MSERPTIHHRDRALNEQQGAYMNPIERLFGPFVDGWQRMVDADRLADLGTDEPVPYLPVDEPADDLMDIADAVSDCGECDRIAAAQAERDTLEALYALVYDPETQR